MGRQVHPEAMRVSQIVAYGFLWALTPRRGADIVARCPCPLPCPCPLARGCPGKARRHRRVPRGVTPRELDPPTRPFKQSAVRHGPKVAGGLPRGGCVRATVGASTPVRGACPFVADCIGDVGRVCFGRWGQYPLSHRLPAAPIALVLLGCMVIGLVTSFRPLVTYGRDNVPSWTSQLDNAAKRCAGRPESTPIGISIAPPGWSMTLTCRQLRE